MDDEPDARNLLATVLDQCGAEVRTCASAAEALAALDEHRPDILVSDIGMPDEDGYALIRQVREKEAQGGPRLPAVALTAYARVEDRLKALSAGYNMHVPKPVEPTEIAAARAGPPAERANAPAQRADAPAERATRSLKTESELPGACFGRARPSACL